MCFNHHSKYVFELNQTQVYPFTRDKRSLIQVKLILSLHSGKKSLIQVKNTWKVNFTSPIIYATQKAKPRKAANEDFFRVILSSPNTLLNERSSNQGLRVRKLLDYILQSKISRWWSASYFTHQVRIKVGGGVTMWVRIIPKLCLVEVPRLFEKGLFE